MALIMCTHITVGYTNLNKINSKEIDNMSKLKINFTVKAVNEEGKEVQTVCTNMQDYNKLKNGAWKNFKNIRISN